MAFADTEDIQVHSGSVVIEGILELPPSPIGVVLFAHGSGSSRFSSRNTSVARTLHAANIGTLLIDLLTHEEEIDYELRFDIGLLTQRLEDAAKWLSHHAATRTLPLGLFGASTGAAAALQLGSKLGLSVAAIVSRGGRPDLADKHMLATVLAPTLLIVGGLDDAVIELNREAYHALNCDKRMAIVPGASHLFEEPGTLEEVASLSAEWFSRHLLSA